MYQIIYDYSTKIWSIMMTPQGIYTLANDVVYDQFIALLNSIERNVSPDIPICVIPYDDRLEKVKREIDSRSNVTLFGNFSISLGALAAII